MPELRHAVHHGNESRVCGRIETAGRHGGASNPSRRRTEFLERRAAVERRGEQHIASRAGQFIESCGESPLQPRREVGGLGGYARRGAFGGNGSRELYEGEWIAGGLREDARANYRMKAGGPKVDQLPGCDGTQTFEVEHGKPGL